MSEAIKRQRIAVVVGVGAENGLGAGLADRFAREGFRVFIAGRSIDGLVRVAQDIARAGGEAIPVVADATSEQELVSLFDYAGDGGSLDVIAFDAGEGVRQGSKVSSARLFEHAWRAAALGGFLVGQEAARRLMPLRHGTIIFSGAIIDRGAASDLGPLVAAKAALRSVAQSLAQEMRPFGIHVAHVIVDGGLQEGVPLYTRSFDQSARSSIRTIVDVCWNIHAEPRYAWTHELDLRPAEKSFRTMRPGAFDSKAGVQNGIAK